MTEQQFQEISKLSSDEFSQLDSNVQVEYLSMLKEKNKGGAKLDIPAQTYVELGANVGLEVADSITGATDMAGKIVAKKTAETLTGTQTAIVYLKMVQSIYQIASGEFKWDLLNTVTLLSSTLACLTAIGINIACMTALTTILASNPFSFALAVIVALINYFNVGSQLAKLKKQYLTCYNSYRRIKKLGKFCDTNEIVYTSIKRVIDGCKDKCYELINKLQSKDIQNLMSRKIFIGADFNSFCLFTNIITFIQSSQDLSTTRNGVYNDYIDFCLIEDYIDTHKIIEQDKCRIEYYILQGDTYGLKNFNIALDYLKGFFDTYKLNKNLTDNTIKNINYVYKCIDELYKAIGTQNLKNLQKDNEKFLDDRNPEELFNSIYSYLIYSDSMKNSPFYVTNTLLNPEFYKEQSIYEYVSAFNEYPVFLFSKWFFYFGNIMYNDIYIENYKNEMLTSYEKNKSLYDYTFLKDLTDNINTFNDYKINLLWLYSIKEFLENIVTREYEKYSPYYATSFTQVATDKDGKTIFNYYTPNLQYVVDNLGNLIDRFKNYMLKYGYDKDNFLTVFDNLFTFINSQNTVEFNIIKPYDKKYSFSNNMVMVVKDNFKDIIKQSKDFDRLNMFADKYILPTDNEFGKLWYNKTVNIFESINEMFFKVFQKKNIFEKHSLSYGDIAYLTTLSYEDFYLWLIQSTKNIFYLYSYIIETYRDNYSVDYFYFYNIFMVLLNDRDLRDMFISGYEFETSNNQDIVYNSYKEYAEGKRLDVIFFYKENTKISIKDIINIMLNKSKDKETLKQTVEDIKIAYNDYINTVKFDIVYINNLINEKVANFENILDKYVKYDSSLSYAYTDKYNTYLWNLYKSARDLGVNNKGYITNINKHLVPVYKRVGNDVMLETYYPPMFILMTAQDDTNISQAYYLYNKTAISKLFDIGNEKFSQKVNEFKDVVDLSIQPVVVEINHNAILENIKLEIEKSYNLSFEELTDLIGTQDTEFITMENLANTDILKSNNEQVNSSNEQLALETQKSIDNTIQILDKKKFLKYSIIGGIGIVLTKILKK